jgi:shikimate kinase
LSPGADLKSTIILIGPMSAGKSTMAKLLAEKLDLPRFELDQERWDYYDEIGYDKAAVSEIARSDQGMLGLLRYWKPFEAHAVARMLAEHNDCIIDFGAGHSVYEEPQLFFAIRLCKVRHSISSPT